MIEIDEPPDIAACAPCMQPLIWLWSPRRRAADWLRRHHAGHLAEGLMELFPEVGAEEAAGWWFEKDEPQRIFVLRTAPTAAKRLAEGDKSNGSEVS